MFKKRKIPESNLWKPPAKAIKYPRWTFVYVEETNEYSLIWDKTRLVFISERAFLSWGKNAILTSKEALSGYKIWKRVGFAPGTLIKSVVDGKTYYIGGQVPMFEEERLLIEDPDFYNILGFNPNLALVVSQKEIDFYKEGSSISNVRFL